MRERTRSVLTALVSTALVSACGNGGTSDGASDDGSSPTADPVTADEAVWSDGDSALRRGDCFVEVITGESTQYELVECGDTHDGEVTTVEACLHGEEFIEVRRSAIASYVGVPDGELADWLESEGLRSMEIWKAGVGSVCYLGGVDGQLTGSYRG